ncbi:YdgA family protein [Candidatus Parabeggiatoa sp. HSG14]|uniref:YdgA family protein n=1 Tax=Candidatus Parabeggiatoa sp. HSG14 TaxID=3055593 RepID=UPI0025A849B4|nr:YdgA family protein [Thiotrichales bacterium HSG14]
MKKILLLVAFLIFVTGSSGIPYWTGVEVERQFTHFNHEFYPVANLKLVDTTYQRGWLRSYAQSTFEPIGVSDLNSKEGHFILAHEIDHGFLPVQSTLIRTTLHTLNPHIELTKISLQKEQAIADAPLLEVHTTVQINGDSVSTLKIPSLTLKNDNAHLQWQGLHGNVYVKHNFATILAEIHSPQIQLKTDQGQIVMQGLSLNADVQPSKANFMQGTGDLSIANVQLASKLIQPVKLEGLKLIAKNNIVNDNLMVAVQTKLQQISVDNKNYGSSYIDFKIQNWHVPTLSRIKNTLVKMHHQGLSVTQQSNIAMFRLMPYGLTLLKNAPEFTINQLNVNTPKGKLRGKMRVKVESFDGNFLVLFNPSLLLNALNVQLDMLISQSLLDGKKTVLSEKTSTISSKVKQYSKTWLDRGLLIPAKNKSDYYRSQMQLSDGILQVNGQQLPITTLFK